MTWLVTFVGIWQNTLFGFVFLYSSERFANSGSYLLMVIREYDDDDGGDDDDDNHTVR